MEKLFQNLSHVIFHLSLSSVLLCKNHECAKMFQWILKSWDLNWKLVFSDRDEMKSIDCTPCLAYCGVRSTAFCGRTKKGSDICFSWFGHRSLGRSAWCFLPQKIWLWPNLIADDLQVSQSCSLFAMKLGHQDLFSWLVVFIVEMMLTLAELYSLLCLGLCLLFAFCRQKFKRHNHHTA